VAWTARVLHIPIRRDPLAAVLAKCRIEFVYHEAVRRAIVLVIAASVLTMMIRMVKQAVPTSDGADLDPGVFFSGASGGGAGGKRRKAEVGQLDSGDDVFGEANEGEAVLTGIELNDDDVQSRKMVDEVSTMVKDIVLGLKEAEALGVPMWVHTTVGQLWRFGATQGLAEADITSLIQVLEDWAGAEVRGRG